MAKKIVLNPKGAKYYFVNKHVGNKKEIVFLDSRYRIIARRITKNSPANHIKAVSPAYAIFYGKKNAMRKRRR